MAESVPGAGAAKGAAGGIGNVLTKKVGPLPVWGYAVALGGGLLALRLFKPGASSGGGVSLSPVPVAAGGAPAGSGADLLPPAVTGPRQAPTPQDTPSTSVASVTALLPPGTWSSSPQPDPVARTLPSPRDLVGTAPVQPPLSGFPTGAKLQTIAGTTYSLSDAAVARGGVTDFGRPAVTQMSGPSGPSVPVGSQYGGVGAGQVVDANTPNPNPGQPFFTTAAASDAYTAAHPQPFNRFENM